MNKRHCVYLHRRKSDNMPFYIGSGVQGKREISKAGRSKTWKEFIENDDFIVEILHSNLCKTESLEIETSLISTSGFALVNKHKPVVALDLDFNLISEYLKYDTNSRTYLTWIKSAGNRSKVGHPAGSITTSKIGFKEHGSVNLLGKSLKIHRVIWVLFGNKIPENYVIDHIDNNPHNNNIYNLRCISSTLNGRNKLIVKNSNLPVGVQFIDKGFERIRANVSTIDGKRLTKSFSIKKYGYEVALAKAKSWRFSEILKQNSEGAGYTENHCEVCEIIDSSHTPQAPYGIPGLKNIFIDGKLHSLISEKMLNGKKRTKIFNLRNYASTDLAIQAAKEFSTRKTYKSTDFGKPVDLYINGTFIKTYPSSSDASRSTGMCLQSISRCCLGKQLKTINSLTGEVCTWRFHNAA